MKSKLVYKHSCFCVSTYIDKTISKSLFGKIEEHPTLQKSEVSEHLLNSALYPSYSLNVHEILCNENCTTGLLILKSFFIQEQAPNLNHDFQCRPLMILVVNKFVYAFYHLHHSQLIFR